MRAITRRLSRLENVRAAILPGSTPAELIMASRHRRIEASGQPYLRRGRQARMKRQLPTQDD